MLDADAEVCVGQKAAQLGYSTHAIAVSIKTVADGRNVLYLLPTRTPDASDFSTTRFDRIIESSDYLSGLFHRNKSMGVKRADSGVIYIRGMNSNSALKSVDVSLLVFDEVDEMPEEKVPLALQRMAGQTVKRCWFVSTPTAPDYGINRLLQESTEGHFFFPCPSCNRQIELLWPESFELRGTSHTDPDCALSYIKCSLCGAKLPHELKHEWLRDAHFINTRESAVLGFYINQLYSPTVSPAEFAIAWFKAQIDLAADQEFYNSMLGLPRLVQGARLMEDDIRDCQGPYMQNSSAPKNRIITIGIDVGKVLHYHVDVWYFDKPCSDINLASTCKTLAVGTVESFEEVKRLIHTFHPTVVVIDSEPETRKALELAAAFPGLIKLCKFIRSAPENAISGTGVIVKTNKTAWVDAAMSRYTTKRIQLPVDLPLEYVSQVCALVRRYKRGGDGELFGQYLSTGPDHYMLARVYSEIALPLAVSTTYHKDLGELL